MTTRRSFLAGLMSTTATPALPDSYPGNSYLEQLHQDNIRYYGDYLRNGLASHSVYWTSMLDVNDWGMP